MCKTIKTDKNDKSTTKLLKCNSDENDVLEEHLETSALK